MSATAGQAADGVRSLADRFGIEPGMVVMEMGYDDDVDEDLRDALIDRCGELVESAAQEFFVSVGNGRFFYASADAAQDIFIGKVELGRPRHLMQLAQQCAKAGDIRRAAVAAVDELPERNRVA